MSRHRWLVLLPLLVGATSGAVGDGPVPYHPSGSSHGLIARSQSEQGAPSIRTDVDTNQISLGGRFRLTVSVEHDEGTTVVWPDSVDLSPFEVLQVTSTEPEARGDRLVSTAQFVVTAFEVGDLELPSFDVSVARDSTSATSLTTDSWMVSVVSVGLDEGGDIRDIKGPLDIPRNWLLLLPLVAALLGAAALMYWLYRRFRRRAAAPARAAVVVPPRPPHEVALEALGRLEASGLLERGDVKTYFIEVADILRRYIEGRYGVDALEMATHEVIDGLESVGLVFETRLEFERFLADCDLVKFAKWKPAMDACRDMVPRARQLVESTKRPGGASDGEAVESAEMAVASPSDSQDPSPPSRSVGEGGRR